MEKKFWYIFFAIIILIFALIIRLNNLDKISGFWYDESTVYSIGSKKILWGMLQEDAHRFLLFPLYFLTYKIWILLFGNSDLIIRLMSVFFDMASVICTYFIGVQFALAINKTEQKNKIGLFSMLLYSINSSFIYYAQEAKFYAMTFFLVNLLILFWLKFLQNSNKRNTIAFLTCNALLLYTYTSQILLISSIQLVTLLYWVITNEKFKKHVGYFIGFLIILTPLLLIGLTQKNYFSGNFDAVFYDNSFILLVIQNWFSPVLTGLQNNVFNYHFVMFSNILNLRWLLYIFFPIIFYFILILKGSKKEILSKLFLAVVAIYLLFHIILSETTSYSVLVRYVLPVLPFIIPIAANGLERLCNKKFNCFILILFILSNLYVLSCPIGATKIQRPDGYKSLANVLIENEISPNQNFILPIRVSLLDKYYNISGEKFSLYLLTSEEYQKTYLTQEELNEIRNKRDLFENYKRFLLSSEVPQGLEKLIKRDFSDKIKTGEKLVLVRDLGICIFNDKQIKYIVNHEKIYKRNSIQFLRLSKLNNILINVISKYLKQEKVINTKNWEVYIFSKDQRFSN